MGTDWSSLDSARAALTDPATRPQDLVEICRAHPSLGAEAAMHSSADRALLEWLAGQGDAITSATAQARLSALPPADAPAPTMQMPQFSAPAPAYQPAAQAPPTAARGTARNTKLLMLVGVGVLVLALVATGIFVVLPWLTGSGTYTYAPDFREQPGIVAVDVQAGLPRSDEQHWSTNVVPVPGTGILLAYNSTSAFSDYQQQLSDYNDAVAQYKVWESDYNTGYSDGESCLDRTDELGWYSSMEDFCTYHESDYVSSNSEGGVAGFLDAIGGWPSTPSQPNVSYYEPPQVPDKPSPPTRGDTIVGVDLKTGKAAWTLELSSVWTGVQPSAWLTTTDAGRTLMLLRDPTQDYDAEAMLAILDDKTGTVSVSRTMDGADVIWAGLYGDVVVLADEDNSLRAVSATDLSTQKWTTSAEFLGNNDEYDPYGYSNVPGYLLTQDGYVRISDGTRAEFARDAGQDGVQLAVLGGTKSDMIRVEPNGESLSVAGFDTGRNEESWNLDDLSAVPVKAGGLMIAPMGEDVAAYRINGSDLDRQWRYSCSGRCQVSFADDSRVFVEDYGDESSELAILKTSDGTRLDRIRDAGYGAIFGKSVLYLQTQDRLVAYDLDKDGTPTLWRSRDVDGWLADYDGSLVLVGSGDDALLGILGLDGDDWSDFAPEG